MVDPASDIPGGRRLSRMAVQPSRHLARALGGLLASAAIALSLVRASAPTVGCDTTIGQITTITIPSTVYEQSVRVSVYLPPCYDQTAGSFSAIYLLHGANTDETQWPDLRVQSEADALINSGASPFIAVMPGGEYRNGLDYAAFVQDDLQPAIESRYRVNTAGSDQAIGGVSLGAYWALKVAFSHPQQFAAVGGYSPVVDEGQPGDPLGLAHSAKGLERLHVMLDVGDADPLRAGALLLSQVLQARGVPVSFTVNPGGHNRPYWRTRTGDFLRFDLDAMAVPHCHSR